jgi:hypothetical protein
MVPRIATTIGGLGFLGDQAPTTDRLTPLDDRSNPAVAAQMSRRSAQPGADLVARQIVAVIRVIEDHRALRAV